MKERKLPIGIQSFEEIRNGNYLYVDKTEYIWNLVQSGKVYFLSRPRRFGKSLLTSTIEAYFLGKKELFKGLYIEKQEKDWITYPVIHFDLSQGNYEEEDGLSDTLNDVMDEAVMTYDLTGEFEVRGPNLPLRFKTLIKMIRRKTGKQVVVLVDEYDAPLLENMDNPELEEKNRYTFRTFFRILKAQDVNIKFVLISGITRFAKISVFSDLNQLKDISINDEYAGICGITEKELVNNFETEMNRFAKEKKISFNECLKQLAKMYDGYHFSQNGSGVYNPFSLLNALQDESFRRYWFGTGTPSFLISMVRNNRITISQLSEGILTSEDKLMDYGGDSRDAVSMLYQTGYLTIRKYDENRKLYLLDFPNDEVRYGFLHSLIPMMLGESNDTEVSLVALSEDLSRGETSSFMNRLEGLLASLPYPESKAGEYEEFWQDRIILIFMLMGERVKSQVHSSNGRSDCEVETDQFVYIFEFKVDKSAEEALKQIEEKGYSDKYKTDKRKLYQIGVNFSSKTRNIEKYLVKEKKG